MNLFSDEAYSWREQSPLYPTLRVIVSVGGSKLILQTAAFLTRRTCLRNRGIVVDQHSYRPNTSAYDLCKMTP